MDASPAHSADRRNLADLRLSWLGAVACATLAVLASVDCGRRDPPARPGGEFPIDVSRQRFDDSAAPPAPRVRPGLAGVFAAARARFDRESAAFDPDSYRLDVDSYSWHESYVLEAYLAAYEGTAEAKYLARIAADIDAVLARRADKLGVRDEVRRRVLPAWAKRDDLGRPYCWLVTAGMIVAPISRWVYLVDRDPALRARWGRQADAYQAAVVETLNAFECDWRASADGAEGYYVFLQGQDHRAGRAPRELPFNGYTTLGRAFVNLYLITGDRKFRARAEKLARRLRRHIRTARGAAVWPYWTAPGYADRPVDTSHGQLDADFAFQCYRAGIVFTRKDMTLLANAFHKATVRDSAGRLLGWTSFIDGTGGRLDFAAGSLDFWSRFGQIDPAVARTLWEGMPLYRHVQPMRMSGLLLPACTEFRPDPVLHAAPSDI